MISLNPEIEAKFHKLHKLASDLAEKKGFPLPDENQFMEECIMIVAAVAGNPILALAVLDEINFIRSQPPPTPVAPISSRN